jgi:catechol 2,3-dioxygenase-like lactoylglutathione lyase family enzyme
MSDSNTARTRGVHHVGLTVPDLGRTRRFFTDVLRFRPVGEVPDYPAVFLSDGSVMLTLWEVQERDRAIAFDRRRGIGLHHLALAVPDDAALDALHERLAAESDVEVEFAPEPLGGGPTRHMMCAIPGGVRVEFIAAANA